MRTMFFLPIMAALATSASAIAPQTLSKEGLLPLTEAELGADALKSAGCYLHDGERVLLVGTKRNGVLNWQGDLLLVQRVAAKGPPSAGASYGSSGFRLSLQPDLSPAASVSKGGRIERPAQVQIRSKGAEGHFRAHWSCLPTS